MARAVLERVRQMEAVALGLESYLPDRNVLRGAW